MEHLLREAQARGDWYYGDNSFFDAGRGTYFRFARDELQATCAARPDFARLKALGVVVKPWRQTGRHIVVVEQSRYHLEVTCGERGWLESTLQALRQVTDRLIVVRHWMRDKIQAQATLQQELRDAWALVTHTSAAASEAILAGVPAFVTGRCAALPMSAGPLSAMESPGRPDGREEWAAGLAAMQWTREELRAGMAWRALG